MPDLARGAAPTYQDLTPTQFAEGLRQPGAVLLDVGRPMSLLPAIFPEPSSTM